MKKVILLFLFLVSISYNGICGTTITGTDKGTNVQLSSAFGYQNVFAGTLTGSVDGNSARFYCIDLLHYLEYNVNYLPAGQTDYYITYILNNYYPYKTLPYSGSLTENKEASAVQMAIWHYSDGLDLDDCGTTPIDITTRAKQIVFDALVNGLSVVPVKTILIYLPPQSFQKGSPIDFWVEVYDELNRPKENITISLSVNNGTLSLLTVTTDASGKSQQVTLTPNSGQMNATITANATVTIPQGTIYKHSINPDGKQKLVIAKPVIANFSATQNIEWWENLNLVINKTADKEIINNGDIITYTITVKNEGIVTANNVKILDILPSELVFISSSGDGTYNSVTGVWDVGQIAVGITKSLTIVARAQFLSPTVIDLGIAKDINLFVLGDMVSSGSDTRGKLYVKNNATLNSYAVGDALTPHSGNVLVVGRSLVFRSGRVYNGKVVYGLSIDTAHANLADDGIEHSSPVDFTLANNYLVNISKYISLIEANGTAVWNYNQYRLTGTNSKINVFNISGTNLSQCTNLIIDCPSTSTVIVNVSGTSVEWHNGLQLINVTKDKVLFNFYDATTLNLAYIGVQGVLLAPLATLNFPSGLVDGQAIVKNMYGQGQFNYTKFSGSITAGKKLINIAQLLTLSQYQFGSGPKSISEVEKSGLTDVNKNEIEIPKEFRLNQNYPNPFNPTTKIDYQLKNREKISLKIYNALGNVVKILVNKIQDAGVYSVDFDAKDLSSGIYYYELQAGAFRDIKKMILIK